MGRKRKTTFLILLFSSLFEVFACGASGPNCWLYERKAGEDPGPFLFKSVESDAVEQKLYFMPQAHNKDRKDSFSFQIRYEGQRVNAEKLISIQMRLFDKGPEFKDREVTVEPTLVTWAPDDKYFYAGGHLVTGALSAMIPNNVAPYRQPGDIDYFYVNYFSPLGSTPPQELTAEITVKWQGGEKQFTAHLVRAEVYRSKPGNRPFG